MGDWEADGNREVLGRIVALLFALAGLADLAAGLPALRRRRLLGILGHGEVEARAFVAGMVCGADISADTLESTSDAARLGVRLRALALVLCVLLARAAPCTPPGPAGPRAGRREPAAAAGRRAAAPAPDTS